MKYFLYFLTTLLIASCTEKQTITQKDDYQSFLENTQNNNLALSEKAVAFWSDRISTDSIQIIELAKAAGGYTGIFQATANINQLKKAEIALTKAVNKAAVSKDGYLRALAQNYITQHRFKEAQILVEQAQEFGGEKKETNFLRFDVAMELGNYDLAKKMLEKTTDFSNYDYLIRRAKWEDYKGNLESTIQHMEKAKAIAESGKQKSLMLWVYTNIADYYGHAGRIQDSYNHYLKALSLDPGNAYAKKGIAYIVYAYENNAQEALRIIEAIEKENKSPDYKLFKAEIYEHLGDNEKSDKLKNEFLALVKNPLYGEMYNAYLIDLYASNRSTTQQAVTLAEREITNRATPETYDHLAYAHLMNGDPKKALEIQQKHVIDKTFEPVAQLHTVQIYKALGMTDKIIPLKEELLEASFELGPITTETVKNL